MLPGLPALRLRQIFGLRLPSPLSQTPHLANPAQESFGGVGCLVVCVWFVWVCLFWLGVFGLFGCLSVFGLVWGYY